MLHLHHEMQAQQHSAMRRVGRQHPTERTTDPLQQPREHPTDRTAAPMHDAKSMGMARSRKSKRHQNSFSLRGLSIMVGTFLFGILILYVYLSIKKNHAQVPTGVRVFHSPNDIPEKILARFDAILILGGGVPQSLEEPPTYVQRRCDDAASVVERRKIIQPTKHKNKQKRKPAASSLPILCLSAGTAHLPQLMSAADGLPIWESTASAAYLQKRYGLIDNVYVETTSYDTIGNAFYARTTHTDIAGWKRLLIVTNEVSKREAHVQ
jgi:uncharacterized SAM-binding protein YcdF (DUF218 family)